MNRNTSSHFSASDNKINIGRSKFDRNSWFKTSMNFGDLIPFYVDEILPGDTFDMKTSLVARMSTPIYPVMDNAYLDTYYFFVPARLVWEHWKEFNGENNSNAWASTFNQPIPSFNLMDEAGLLPYAFSLPDYFGLPTITVSQSMGSNAVEVSALPFRAYQLIWNEWFRDQNLQQPLLIHTSDTVSDEEREKFMEVLKVNKFHDYFTSALPAPQKGPAVLIPGLNDMLVMENEDTLSGYDLEYPSQGTSMSIDALRTAFQIQKLLWRDGNGGTRYTEILRSHFGVVSPDGRLQRPEYLGGKRIPITINQVIQQSQGGQYDTNSTPLGNAGAISKTVDSFDGFTKSFTEHGYLIGVCCARTDHTYQQGINRLWTRRNRFDFYYPELANIGEQPILNKEIYVQGTDEDEEVFGYQEAWAEYRYRPSYVTGALRSQYDQSLDAWHYGDYYTSLPRLSAGWIAEPLENVNRTLAVQGTDRNHDQLIIDFYFDLTCTRPMPVYSVPGLVDHF